MTILPKKKQNKNNDEDRDKDHSNERYNYSNSNQNEQLSSNNRTWSSRSDDKRPAPDSDLAGDHSSIGNPHLKRRHRNNRERDVNSDLQRSHISSGRTISKSSIKSPSSSPRDHNNQENDLTLPGCSGMKKREEKLDISHSNILVPVGLALREDEEQDKKDISGYNSGDEYHKPSEHVNNIDWEEKERNFERKIRKIGFNIRKMCEDGACLFRAVADQVYGDQEMHTSVRKLCMDYMEKNSDYFCQYITENFAEYVERKRSDHIHGNHVEIQALSEIYNRPIQVYIYSNEPMNIFHGCQQTDNEPIRLSYHRNVHYNSIIDPYKATVGVGLGLPGYKPGLAENSLMEKAIRISEQHELEQAMLEDKIRATDWEATSEAIEEQIARESYLEWLRENELRSRKKASATSTFTAAHNQAEDNLNANIYLPKSSKGSSRASSKSPLQDRGRGSPKRGSTEKVTEDKGKSICSNQPIEENASFIHHVPPQVLGLNEWDDDDDADVLAHAIALSQAEYIESLKASACSTSKTNAILPIEGTSSKSSSRDYSTSLPSTSSKYPS